MSLDMPRYSAVRIQAEKDRLMLLRLARAGDRQAQESLYREYGYKQLEVDGKVLDLEEMFGKRE